jgi:hypothetical protein
MSTADDVVIANDDFDAELNEFDDEHEADAADEAICYAIQTTANQSFAEQFQAVIRGKCAHCGEEGHFVRDCKKLGGTGKSVVGQRYGTAIGFKENDNPDLRPEHYKKARAQRDQRMKGRLTNSAKIVSKRKGGKNSTYARRLRTGAATSPAERRYLSKIGLASIFNLIADEVEKEQESPFDMNALFSIMNDHPDDPQI